MDKGKKIEVGSSTLVDLKAEIFRKQEELKHQKVNQPNVRKPSLKLGNKIKPQLDSLGKANPGVGGRDTKDQEYRILDEGEKDALAASRKKLEEKAILYEKMMLGRSIPDDDCCMVDFQRKTLDVLQHNKMNNTSYKSQIGIAQEQNLEQDNENEWTDYTDSLGRSRRCLNADLPRMVAIDLDLQQRNSEHSSQNEQEKEEEPLVPSMENTLLAPEAPVGPVHYQNVQFNEIRSHGVGYFGFSQSEEERKKQMEMLNELRNQTKMQKERLQKVKEKRQAALQARLKKVKQRKLLKEGNILPDSESGSDEEEKLPETIQEVVAIPNKEEAVEEQKEKPSTVRPWDRGKIVPRVIQPFRQASQKEWVDKQREERLPEFAPPSSYYQNDPVEEMHQFFTQQRNTFGFQEFQQHTRSPSTFLANTSSQFSPSANVSNIPLPDY